MDIASALDSLLAWLLRFGRLYLVGAAVAAGLAFVLMELTLELVDDHMGGFSTVRLRVRQKLTPSLVLWVLLRRGLPLAAALLVFYLFMR